MRTMFVGMTVFAFLLGLVVWGMRYLDDLRQTQRCGDILFKQTALGILACEERTSTFPPAYTVDAQGRRMQSWRDSILPWFQEMPLYNEYRHDEPWDGPNNRRLHGEQLHGCYRCPADLSEPTTATDIVAVVGPDTAWPETMPNCSKNCVKGASHTALLVEVARSGIHWMEPRDLELSDFDATINSRSGRGLSSNHAAGVNVAMADGSVRCLSPNTAPEVLKAMLMTGGSDDVSSGKPTVNKQPRPDQRAMP
jgi:prepilin-type processing-associated H-X9-DG protein